MRSNHSLTAPRRGRRRIARAFTLVELLVALAAGLAVSAAAFLLAKAATRSFQEEARLSSAHLSATLGLHRLSADLQRAGLLSTANAQRDPAVCGAPSTWPEGMRRLAGIAIRRQGSVGAHAGQLGQSLANGLGPDSIVIGGAAGTAEQFPIRMIQTGVGGGHDVYLQIAHSGAMSRTLARGGAAALAGVFRAGRALRVVMPGQTRFLYGVIAGVDVAGDPPLEAVVHLAPSPALPPRGGGDCGLGLGANVGGLASPVSRIRYDIRSLAGHDRYGDLVAPISPAVTGDAGRTELVRVELDADDQEMPDTLELVAEYAVDLKFGLSVASAVANPAIDPVVSRRPIAVPDDGEIYNTAAEVTDGGRPERIRSIQVRLSTRARAPDREADLGDEADGRRRRFLLPGIVPGVDPLNDTPPPGAPPVYARLRTFYADVALPNNQAGDQRW
ncbi:MAG: prepilin-type N-terminal cleavage/methylation domain-containing protein [Polyangiaceae bacterium]|nr:prepilin-type N-terminal cleavage/methylation domain-containing protein [Polyangiaceae bacterium]